MTESGDITPTLGALVRSIPVRPDPCAYCSYADDAKTRAELAANRAEEETMVLRSLLDNIIEAWEAWVAAEENEAGDLNKAVRLARASLARCGTTRHPPQGVPPCS